MKTPKAAVQQLADRIGAAVEWDSQGSLVTIQVAAPRGKHWTDGRVHELRIESRPTTAVQLDDLWIDALRRMEHGLEDCDLNDQDCADWAFE